MSISLREIILAIVCPEKISPIKDSNLKRNEKLEISISNITEPQKRMLEHLMATMQNLGNVGASRTIKIFCDGDGSFRPKITVDDNQPKFDSMTQVWSNYYMCLYNSSDILLDEVSKDTSGYSLKLKSQFKSLVSCIDEYADMGITTAYPTLSLILNEDDDLIKWFNELDRETKKGFMLTIRDEDAYILKRKTLPFEAYIFRRLLEQQKRDIILQTIQLYS